MQPGYYSCALVRISAGRNDNGKQLVEVIVQNDDGEEMPIYLYFTTDEARRISLEQLQNLGWTRGQALQRLVGKTDIRVQVYVETYQGKERLRARFAYSAIVDKMSDEEMNRWINSL